MIAVLFWSSVFLVLYVYAGYPLVLWMLARRPAKPVVEMGHTPVVTLIVSAFNEEDVIADKIENSLLLNYPRENLQILVVSDASDDRTDSIVQSYSDRSVELVRMPQRGGKTVGLNAAVLRARGSVLVFSDANAMFESDAVQVLVRNFADERVGAVIGESGYRTGGSNSERSEGLYWRYETWVKALESARGSVVGGDGAIYAVRKSLYRAMPSDALSDFVNPLQVVRDGYRCVYDANARSFELASKDFRGEFRRKVRIVNRAWRATMKMREMLNPFRFPEFAPKLISHKLLRWLVPVDLLLIAVSNIALLGVHWIYDVTAMGQLAFYALGAIGWVLGDKLQLPSVLMAPYYFCLVNVASAKGIVEAWMGQTYTTWSTVRAN